MDGNNFIPLNEICSIDFDFIIVAAADYNRADIYHQAEKLEIDRIKLIRAEF